TGRGGAGPAMGLPGGRGADGGEQPVERLRRGHQPAHGGVLRPPVEQEGDEQTGGVAAGPVDRVASAGRGGRGGGGAGGGAGEAGGEGGGAGEARHRQGLGGAAGAAARRQGGAEPAGLVGRLRPVR